MRNPTTGTKIQNPTSKIRNVLIVADIEGSSGCWDYRFSSFRTPQWAQACVAMTLDISAVVDALFNHGVKRITVKDFHRTGYNLLPEMIDSRSEIRHGYRRGPVPGIGNPGRAQVAIFMGMHAASGTDGFLAHTLTSRIKRLSVNDRPLAEIELLAAVLAPYGIKPILFSGCPVACQQAQSVIENIDIFPIDKPAADVPFDAEAWRAGLAHAAAESLANTRTEPYQTGGPLEALMTMRDGQDAARTLARRWKLDCQEDQLLIRAAHMRDLYLKLIRICYLTPLIEKTLPIGLLAFNLWGRLGLAWVRRQVKKKNSGIEELEN